MSREQALRAHVQHLTGECHPRDHAHPENMWRAAQYVHGQMASLGLPCEFQEFDLGAERYANVATTLGPSHGPRVIVGAHYDTCGPHPGADDNASGVAGLLELARSLVNTPPRTGVDFMAYALEEPPHFGTSSMGSAHHARMLQSDGVQVKAMIALEMIGYFTDQPASQRYPLRALELLCPSVGNFIAVIGRHRDSPLVRRIQTAMCSGAPMLPVVPLSLPHWVPGVTWSDHQSYWNAGYPAVMVSDTSLYRNPHFHSAQDLPATLDFERMADVVLGVAAAVRDLAK